MTEPDDTPPAAAVLPLGAGVLPEPERIRPADLPALAAAVTRDAEAETDVGVVGELLDRWKAIATYMARKTTEGQAAVKATELRLLARIGQLSPALSPRESGALRGRSPRSGNAADQVELSPNRMTEARKLAAVPDLVDQVIAGATDENPPTKAAVLRAVPAGIEPTLADSYAKDLAGARRAIERARQLLGQWDADAVAGAVDEAEPGQLAAFSKVRADIERIAGVVVAALSEHSQQPAGPRSG